MANHTGNASNESIDGSDGNDTLTGAGGNDTIEGGFGRDIISGGSGDDLIFSTTPPLGVQGGINFGDPAFIDGDTIDGGADNDKIVVNLDFAISEDTVIANAPNMVVEGGTGNDTLTFTDTHNLTTADGSVPLNVVDLAAGTATPAFGGTIEISGIENVVHTFAGDGHYRDHYFGDGNNNLLSTGAEDDRLVGRGGHDTLLGGDDQDWLQGDEGFDLLFGGDGNDTLLGGANADNIDGGEGIDLLNFANTTAAVTVVLLDFGSGGSGSGGDAAGDKYWGIENVTGSRGSDTLIGDGEDNVLNGFFGNDVLVGGVGADTLTGFLGNDTLVGGTGADTLNGGVGIDTASFVPNSGIGVQLDANGDAVALSGITFDNLISIENLIGSNIEDFLGGNDSANRLEGLDGNDLIEGGGGADTMLGGDGLDTLTGGAGGDQLTGGANADTFTYLARSDSQPQNGGSDRIIGFQLGVDVIDLSAIDADNNQGGDQAFEFRLNNLNNVQAGEVIARFNAASNTTRIEVHTNGDGEADMRIILEGQFDPAQLRNDLVL